MRCRYPARARYVSVPRYSSMEDAESRRGPPSVKRNGSATLVRRYEFTSPVSPKILLPRQSQVRAAEAITSGALALATAWYSAPAARFSRNPDGVGVRAVVLTNAAGGIQQGYHVGQLVALADHINQMGWNPLTGPNEPRFAMRKGAGLRFFDMTEAYSKRLRSLAKEAAAEDGFVMTRAFIWRLRAKLRDACGDSRLPHTGGYAGGHVDGAGDDCGTPHGHRGVGHFVRDKPGGGAWCHAP